MSHKAGSPAQKSDDELARVLLNAAQSFTSQVSAVAAGLRARRPELAGHFNQLAADIAGTVLEAVRTWPEPGR